MSKIAVAILFCLLASPAGATTYYLATAAGGGNDSNNGLSSGAPWLTPNHAVNCGDVISAAASTAYAAANFNYSKWGTVTCAGRNNVAWLKCATFDACKISASGSDAMKIAASYWGVQGWELTSSTGACVSIVPASNSVNIHHIIVANNVLTGCMTGAVTSFNNSPASWDYVVYLGNIAYNGAGGSAACYSGFNFFSPVNNDTQPGTHIYVAGNLANDNVDPNPCNGGAPSDGEGISFDTVPAAYTGQVVADNNILIFNGGRGVADLINTNAHVYFRHNTAYGNDTNNDRYICTEIGIDQGSLTEIFWNLAMTNPPAACVTGGHVDAAFQINSSSSNGAGGSSDHIYNNFGYDSGGNNLRQTGTNTGFVAGPNNTFGTNPNFANPVDPGAPSCGSASSVPNCMATVIANFTPRTAAAVGYGYQIPSTAQSYDPLFPEWLCNVNLPVGLVTMGCLAQSSLPAPPMITSVKVQ